MARNNAFDSREIERMFLPYAPNIGYLAEKELLTSGYNTFVTFGGNLRKALGSNTIGSTASFTLQAYKTWIYETLENSPVTYVVGSFKNGSVYELYYQELSSPDTWHLVTERRGCNHSTTPHEGLVKRGFMYIKGTPSGSDDSTKLGSIRLDGTGGTMDTHDWGALAPTTAVALSDPSGWSNSAHAVTVQNSWIYVYTWVLESGQETNHSPLQTNPDADPSSTGPFSGKIPNMTLTGPADTTEYPFVNVYRTTDGGGTFFFLYQVANTGGSITFNDTFLASGSGNMDPLPDIYLDTSHQAPYLQSNSPPPTVTPPLVTGTDDIVKSSRIVEYSGRIWYGINEYLFFSALEELATGVPEESWPSGLVQPNFFRMPETITNLVRTPDGLLVVTRKQTIRVSGTSLSTFNPRPFLGGEGGAYNQSRAATEVGENGAWLTQDYRISVVHGTNYAIITNPIGDALKTAVADGALVELAFWNQGDKKYLICACHRPDNPVFSQWFIYDLDRAVATQDDFWFTPWNKKTVAITVGQSSVADTENKLFLGLYGGGQFQLAVLDPSGVMASDPDPSTLTPTGYGWSFRTSLLPVPVGDHISNLREPDMSPVVASVSYEKTSYTGDSLPVVNIYVDNKTALPTKTLTTADPPARRAQSIGYGSYFYSGCQTVSKHVALELVGGLDTIQAEISQIAFEWLPDAGA